MKTTTQPRTFESLAAARQQARALRDNGTPCKVLRHDGTYTQPGRGIVSFTYYTVAV